MAQVIQSGNVTAAVTGSLTAAFGGLPTGATQDAAYGTATNQTTTLYTVGAGVSFYITAMTISAEAVSAGGGVSTLKLGSGDILMYAYADGLAGQKMNSNQAVSLMFPIEVAAGDTIQLISPNGNVVAYATVWGYYL